MFSGNTIMQRSRVVVTYESARCFRTGVQPGPKRFNSGCSNHRTPEPVFKVDFFCSFQVFTLKQDNSLGFEALRCRIGHDLG